MSVFASHPKTHHFRTAVLFLALCAVVAGGAVVARAVRAPLTAAIRSAFVPSSRGEPSASPAETVFPQSREVDWDGVVFAMLAGNRGIAVRNVATGAMFQAYFKDGQASSVSYQPVLVHGRWTGIDCAYRSTLFKDQCTPTVDIDALEILPIMFE